MTKFRKKPSASHSLSEAGNGALAVESPARQHEPIPVDEQIRTRAYEFYLESGDRPGDDLGNWLRAEHEYRAHAREANH
jgi:Protein of unknown function (DUF2934)